MRKILTPLATTLLIWAGAAAAHIQPPDPIINLTPQVEPITQQVTEEELHLIARWEDGDLYLDPEVVRPVLYPPTGSQLAHAASCDTRSGCMNGCTVGYGFNMGAYTRDEVYSIFFVTLGMPHKQAWQYRRYADKIGTAALEVCGEHIDPAQRPGIDATLSWRLLAYMAQKHKNRVLRKAEQEGLVKMVGGQDVLGKLSASQFAALLSIDYSCNDSCIYKAVNLWRHLRGSNFSNAYVNLRYFAGCRVTREICNRRKYEANYFCWATSKAGGLCRKPRERQRQNDPHLRRAFAKAEAGGGTS